MNKNMGGNICSVKASIVGFNLILNLHAQVTLLGAIILKVGETMGSLPCPILNNLSKFQCYLASMNQHPLVHQLGVLYTTWGWIFGGISHLIPESTLTTIYFFWY